MVSFCFMYHWYISIVGDLRRGILDDFSVWEVWNHWVPREVFSIASKRIQISSYMIRRWIGESPKGRPQTWYLFTICVFGKRTQGIQGISKIQWIQSLQFFFRLADASTGTTTGGMGGSARRVEGFTDSPVRRYSRFLSFFDSSWCSSWCIYVEFMLFEGLITSARRSPHRRSASAVTVVTGRQPKNRAARGSTGSHGKAQNMAPGDKRSEGLQSSFTS